MAFIRTRKLRYDDNNKIISGTAAIIESHYIPGNVKHHSKQVVREKLGKVIELYNNKKGLFLSPTRGLVIYNSETDEFSDPVTKEKLQTDSETPAVSERLYSAPRPASNVHKVFGDAFLLLEIMEKTGLISMLQEAFPEKTFYERLLCHMLHEVLKDGSRITCDDFIAKSFASYIVKDIPLDTLKSDTSFFSALGEEKTKLAFFISYVKWMRSKDPTFGKACFVDTAPLPNDMDSPFGTLCSQGIAEAAASVTTIAGINASVTTAAGINASVTTPVGINVPVAAAAGINVSATTAAAAIAATSTAAAMQMRLLLILDESSLRPLWFDIIPDNMLDLSTLRHIAKDVEASLDIHINDFYLDAGYASEELIRSFQIQGRDEEIPEKKYLLRMPAKRGYPHRLLYTQMKELFPKAKYDFVREGHSYFGKMKQISIFGTEVYAYVYVDHYNALKGYTEFKTRKPEEFEKLSAREQDWNKVKNGYFVLISNYRKSPAEALDDYFSRTRIETIFKTDKEYLQQLQHNNWNEKTIKGKILSDVIDFMVSQTAHELGKGTIYNMSSMIGKAQSLMCFIDSKDNTVYIETPSHQVKDYYKGYGIPIPETLNLDDYAARIIGE